MKKNILFLGVGDKKWIGGLYYVKNMLFSLLQYEKTEDFFQIYVLINRRDFGVFEEYEKKYKNVRIIIDKNSAGENVRKKIRKEYCNLLGRSCEWALSAGIVEKYHIDLIFPLTRIDDKYIDKEILWIPDFQHYHYPEFFSEEEIKKREKYNLEIARKHKKLLLSSQDAYLDYKNIFPDNTQNVFVVPFISDVEKILITTEEWEKVRNKFDISEKFFLVANQFWPHKNHITVFKAINILKRKYNVSVNLICTGALCEQRTPEHIAGLMRYIQDNDLQQEIRILGLIDRREQLILMERSLAVIQPSLFEGWGTVVEDAKTLNVPVIMSDIAVHYEQMIDNYAVFDKEDAEQLAEVLLARWRAEKKLRISYDYVQCAKKYGRMFYEALQS